MNATRFQSLAANYGNLHIAVVGDFCLDRYLEIDPNLRETSIETGLPVHNVVRVRPQPGGAGTILNNLCTLGVGAISPIGFVGDDGEGYELRGALERLPGTRLDWFFRTPQRRTFTYCKPLVTADGKPPQELNRLDSKNWTPTPQVVEDRLVQAVEEAAQRVNAVLVLDQVDVPETGVVTQRVLRALGRISERRADLLILADSRRGLGGFPPVSFKMNLAELAMLSGFKGQMEIPQARVAALQLAQRNGRRVFVTMAGEGILGAGPNGEVEHLPSLPLRGEIDVVGAGDAVSANLGAALAAGATLRESIEIANAAASVVIHKLGTTGTASPAEIVPLLHSP